MWKIGIFPGLRAIRNEVFHKSNMFFRLDYENSRPFKGFQLKNTSKIQDPAFWHLRTSCPHSAQCGLGNSTLLLLCSKLLTPLVAYIKLRTYFTINRKAVWKCFLNGVHPIIEENPSSLRFHWYFCGKYVKIWKEYVPIFMG